MDFPIFNSKELSDGRKYDLTDPVDRKKYFESKLGKKIEEVKTYLDEGNGFVGFLLAKKQAGKGTYSKMIEEILGPERFIHISVGDVVRKYHVLFEDPAEKARLLGILKPRYRGYMSLDDAVAALLNRSSNQVSVPSELLLELLKIELSSTKQRGIFIDGLPRTTDQVSYSLIFRDIINFTNSPDFFVLIDVPEAVIDARMKSRVVCPICSTSKSLLSNPTKFVNFDPTKGESGEYYFICDNANCTGYESQRLTAKEGDSAGLESIRERLNLDQQLMEMAFNLHGVPRVLLRGPVPIASASLYLEDYEIQSKYIFSGGRPDAHGKSGEVTLTKEPWVFKDDAGVDSYTTYAAVYTLNLFSQIHGILV